MNDPIERFSNRADHYHKFRPSYPLELLEVLKKKDILSHNSQIADIGSGTGIFSQLLLEIGCAVYGVEPNDAMRAKAEESLSKYSNFHSINGRAEATGLKDHSIDIITVAQAFHWFDLEKTQKEFQRILRSKSYLVLIWNERLIDEIPFQKEYDFLLNNFCPEYVKPSSQKVPLETIKQFYGNNKFKKFNCPYYQSLDFEGLKGRLESASYCLRKDDPDYYKLFYSLKKIFDFYQINGKIELVYRTKMFYGQMS